MTEANRTEDQQLIESVKLTGIKSALFDEVRRRLHAANRACEEGAKDSFKDFRNQLQIARDALHAAEVCYIEWYNL